MNLIIDLEYLAHPDLLPVVQRTIPHQQINERCYLVTKCGVPIRIAILQFVQLVDHGRRVFAYDCETGLHYTRGPGWGDDVLAMGPNLDELDPETKRRVIASEVSLEEARMAAFEDSFKFTE